MFAQRNNTKNIMYWKTWNCKICWKTKLTSTYVLEDKCSKYVIENGFELKDVSLQTIYNLLNNIKKLSNSRRQPTLKSIIKNMSN